MSYDLAAVQLIAFLEEHDFSSDVASISTDHIRLLENALATKASATARQRNASLKQLFKWLHEEGEIAVNPMDRIKAPALQEPPVPVLNDDQLRALIATAAGMTSSSGEMRRSPPIP